jgi:hypothetical protein
MTSRRRLGFPPTVPFVNYQKHDAVEKKQKVVLKWAQEGATLLSGAGDQVAELMNLYTEALRLKGEQPRKQVRHACCTSHMLQLLV